MTPDQPVEDLINQMFSQVLDSLSQVISNDLAVAALGIISLTLIITAFFLVRDMLGLGLSDKEKGVRESYQSWQRHKGTWRGDLKREEYQRRVKSFIDESDEERREHENSIIPGLHRR